MGAGYLSILLMLADGKMITGPAVMLALKCLANMWKNPASQHVMTMKRQKVLDAVA